MKNQFAESNSEYFQTFNLNKQSLTLDIKSDEGRDVLCKLIKNADAIINNLRGNQPDQLGIDYSSLKSINPKIVCGHISAYGRDNSRASWPGYDYLMQAESGFLSLTGEPDSPPSRFGLSMVDFMTGMMLAFGVVSAIMSARKSGKGADVDISLFDAALHQLTYPGIWYLNEGHVTERIARGAHPSVTPSQLIKTKDGWVFVMCQNPRFWNIMLETIERKDIGEDERFSTMSARLENRDELTKILDGIFSILGTGEWIEKFKGLIPIAPVYNISKALDNPFLSETNMVGDVDHNVKGKLRILNNPLKLNGERLPAKCAPSLGADTDHILKEIGLSDKQIGLLRDNGII